MVTDTTYFSIQAWMVTKLNLKGCERDVYAIIYGYSQDGESDYHGSLKYMSELTGYSKNSICTALKGLTERNLIVKTEQEINNVKFCRYRVNFDSIQETCIPVQETCINNKQNTKIEDKVLSKDNTTNFQFGKPKQKKESMYTKCVHLIDAKTDDRKIRSLLISWLDMLLEKYCSKDKVLYTNVFKGKLNMLDKFDKKDWKEIIEYNLQRGYEGFYPISKSNYNSDYRTGKPWEEGLCSDQYTDEELEELEERTRQREAQGLRARF